MARESDFRQRAVTTANLLLEAASMLQRPREESSLSDFDTQSRGNLQVGPRGILNHNPVLSSTVSWVKISWFSSQPQKPR